MAIPCASVILISLLQSQKSLFHGLFSVVLLTVIRGGDVLSGSEKEVLGACSDLWLILYFRTAKVSLNKQNTVEAQRTAQRLYIYE